MSLLQLSSITYVSDVAQWRPVAPWAAARSAVVTWVQRRSAQRFWRLDTRDMKETWRRHKEESRRRKKQGDNPNLWDVKTWWDLHQNQVLMRLDVWQKMKIYIWRDFGQPASWWHSPSVQNSLIRSVLALFRDIKMKDKQGQTADVAWFHVSRSAVLDTSMQSLVDCAKIFASTDALVFKVHMAQFDAICLRIFNATRTLSSSIHLGADMSNVKPSQAPARQLCRGALVASKSQGNQKDETWYMERNIWKPTDWQPNCFFPIAFRQFPNDPGRVPADSTHLCNPSVRTKLWRSGHRRPRRFRRPRRSWRLGMTSAHDRQVQARASKEINIHNDIKHWLSKKYTVRRTTWSCV